MDGKGGGASGKTATVIFGNEGGGEMEGERRRYLWGSILYYGEEGVRKREEGREKASQENKQKLTQNDLV